MRILLSKGRALWQLKRYEEALLLFEGLLRENPANIFACAGKGLSLHRLKRYTEALEAYERVLQLHPNSRAIYLAKSRVLWKMRRYWSALAAYWHGQTTRARLDRQEQFILLKDL